MIKRIVSIFSIVMAAVLVIFWVWFSELKPPAQPFLIVKGETIKLEIADTPAKQTQGLSGHAPLAENEGMLFIFPTKQIRTFWMKEMLFPLDIIWITDDRVAGFAADLPPAGATPKKTYSSPQPSNYVLEVNAGWAARHGVKAGDSIDYHL